MNLNNKGVMVVGTGVSGIGAVRLLNRVGANVILYDGNEQLSVAEVQKKLNGEKAEIIIGAIAQSVEKKVELLVISPGVPIDSELVTYFAARGIPVWGEIELAYNYEQGTVIAITGTNGKTTTTSLVGQIVRACQPDTYVVGNIGNSYTGEVHKTAAHTYTVAEISSFQLETVHAFHPKVGAILNITPDHLNRHKTMENYAYTKEKICENQTKEDVCVLNYDDPILREFAGTCKATVIWFGRQNRPAIGAYLDGDQIMYHDADRTECICNVHDMQLIGTHNYENVMAAVAITIAAGIPLEIIRREIQSFQAVEHRIEYVATKNGVKYYNDSKGTNPEAAVKAIEAMPGTTILIGGGYDKKSEFDLYVKAFQNKVKLLVLMGQTREKIAETAKKYGFDNIIMVESMEEAVKVCAEHAKDGEYVLLSPACASWGMFDNYEQREEFLRKQFVHCNAVDIRR